MTRKPSKGTTLTANPGIGHALTVCDKTPKEANSSDKEKHKIFNTNVKPEIRERFLTFNALKFNLRDLRKANC